MANPKLCSIADCGNPHVSSGWCTAHYHRWKRYGDPLGGRPTMNGDLGRYYRDVVMKYESADCLIWPYTRTQSGYAGMKVKGRPKIVSRLVCEELFGPPPTAVHEAAHSCGKGKFGCVSPRHLSWKTPIENTEDRRVHGTMSRGESHGSAKITEADALEIRALTGKVHPALVAKHFGIGDRHVRSIMKGEKWSHLGSQEQ